jgi:hypothetical protein
LVAGIIALAAGVPAWTWGHEGHRIVARIAAKNLSPEAQAKVALILHTTAAGVEAAMADAATWPDEINKVKTETGNWHFIDVPVTAPFDTAGLCPNHACVIDQINAMVTRLEKNRTGFTLAAEPEPPRPMTSEELAFLIHFVGDIHQPLHAATDGDKGGNCVNLTHPIVHPDHTRTTELHALWDVDVVMSVMARHGNDEAQTANALFQQFKSGTNVSQGTAEQWARESNDLARQDIYQKLALPDHTAPPTTCAAGIAPVAIGPSYLNDTASDAEQQLLRAGIRLSNVLNEICAGNGCAANPRKKT